MDFFTRILHLLCFSSFTFSKGDQKDLSVKLVTILHNGKSLKYSYQSEHTVCVLCEGGLAFI